MEYKLAAKSDIADVLSLHQKYHVQTIAEKEKKDGFVTTQLDEDLLCELIEKENGLFIAVNNKQIIAYAMSASWDYCSKWPMFQYMINKLGEIEFLGQQLTVRNSYQYGPICIEKEFRGTGVFERLFDFTRGEMHKKYPILVTFVNTKNPRSVKAHMDKLKMVNVKEFKYNNNSYIELVYDTSKKLF